LTSFARRIALTHRSPKTVNNVLTLLNTLLKKAVEWNELDRLQCTTRLLPNPRQTMGFLDFAECERLLVAARNTCPEARLMVLLGERCRTSTGRHRGAWRLR